MNALNTATSCSGSIEACVCQTWRYSWLHLLANVGQQQCWFNFTVLVNVPQDKAKEAGRWVEIKKALWIVWPHIFYYVLFITATIFFIVR